MTDKGYQIFLDDDTVNTCFGGILNAIEYLKGINEVSYNGETVSIVPYNTLRNGCVDCIKLVNYSNDTPDSPSFYIRLWNKFAASFTLNFGNGNWLYLAKGLVTTLEITLLSAILGIFIGIIVAIVRCTHDKTGALEFLNSIFKAYIAVIRGTPVMIQLIIIYFVILLPIGIAKFPAAVLCFGINSGSYVAEIVRGGLMAVDQGQDEAGRSLGFNYVQTMIYIIIPQAFKAILPALANEFISLLKETSIAFYIGVADLTQGGLKIRSITYSNFMPLVAVALIYFILVSILTKLVSLLEKRLRKSER
ncbi:MAG: ABC transporter permease subunit [Ruminococcaceae bacterium]|nr:ABC transporter permease subunit [Oscillospiraceae bacterium]